MGRLGCFQGRRPRLGAPTIRADEEDESPARQNLSSGRVGEASPSLPILGGMPLTGPWPLHGGAGLPAIDLQEVFTDSIVRQSSVVTKCSEPSPNHCSYFHPLHRACKLKPVLSPHKKTQRM